MAQEEVRRARPKGFMTGLHQETGGGGRVRARVAWWRPRSWRRRVSRRSVTVRKRV